MVVVEWWMWCLIRGLLEWVRLGFKIRITMSFQLLGYGLTKVRLVSRQQNKTIEPFRQIIWNMKPKGYYAHVVVEKCWSLSQPPTTSQGHLFAVQLRFAYQITNHIHSHDKTRMFIALVLKLMLMLLFVDGSNVGPINNKPHSFTSNYHWYLTPLAQVYRGTWIVVSFASHI